nr:phosphoserine phosphatase [Nocardioidaceae bacterium]
MTSAPLPPAPAPYDGPTLLVTLTGRDRPGLVAALFAACAGLPVDVLDIEQVVIRGRIVLGALLTAPRDDARLRRTLAAVAVDLEVDIEVERGHGDAVHRGARRTRVTLLG